jgi:hypothetical protein
VIFIFQEIHNYDNKTFLRKLFKNLRFSARKWAVKIGNFEKKIHCRVKILGWYEKQPGTFSASEFLVYSKNGHVLYVSRINLTAKIL